MKAGVPFSASGIRAAGGSSRVDGSATVRNTRNGIPAASAARATIALSRSTASAPVSRQARILSSSVARMARETHLGLAALAGPARALRVAFAAG